MMRWFLHLGGIGLIPLGLIDSSVIPLPGSMDIATIVVPALLPPPFPLVPFLVAAGAMQYSRAKFLVALTLGRAIRYTILTFLAQKYGRQILSFLSHHVYTLLFVSIGVAAAGAIVVLLIRAKSKK